MLSNLKNLFKLTAQVIKQCEYQSSFRNDKLLTALGCEFCLENQKQNFHTSMPRMDYKTQTEVRKGARVESRKEGKLAQTFTGDVFLKRKEGFFPTHELPETLFHGIPFKDIPIVYIKATRNNTHMNLMDQGLTKLIRTCGIEGFKNSRKGTNVAAQATGTSFGFRALKRGYKSVRVVVGGLGPGRLAAIKGMQLAGVNIISISDNTVDCTPLRPRKQRRL